MDHSKGKFQLSLTNHTTYEGYSDGTRWNGYACPLFTYEEAEKILQELKELNDPQTVESWEYDEDSTSFVVYQSSYPKEPEIFEGVVSNDIVLYGIGAFSWTWHETK